MSSRHSWFLVLALALLLSTAFANKKEAEGEALIKRAKQLSDIRAQDAPPFQLRISFKMIKDGTALQGTYTEVWDSKTQWRKETVIGDFRRTQVAEGRKRWLLDGATAEPEDLDSVFNLTDVGRFNPEVWKPQKVEDRDLNGHSMHCLETKPNSWGGRSALCFDKVSGTITAEVRPFLWGTRIGETVCFYDDYQRFGDHLLARSYKCDKDKQPILEARVVELAAAPATGSAFFTPPDGAKESINCLSPVKPPKAVNTPSPEAPRTSGGQTIVVVDLIVGIDGKPHNLKVTSAPNHNFDVAAHDAVRRWTFTPGTCDGEPIETHVVVDVNFQLP